MQQTVAVIVPLLNEIEALPTMLAALSGNGATELIMEAAPMVVGSGYNRTLAIIAAFACSAVTHAAQRR